jgi:hypothetical protein
MICAVYGISSATAMVQGGRWHRYGAKESSAHQGRAKKWKN